MKFATLMLAAPLILTACGIDVKTPKEMDLKLDLDAKHLAQQIRQGSTSRIPPQYLKFLKDNALKDYLQKTAKNLNGDCLIPTQSMTHGEQQGTNYVFYIAQRCYVLHEEANNTKTLRVEFEISGDIDTTNLKHEFFFDEFPDAKMNEVPREEYENLKIQGRFLPQI